MRIKLLRQFQHHADELSDSKLFSVELFRNQMPLSRNQRGKKAFFYVKEFSRISLRLYNPYMRKKLCSAQYLIWTMERMCALLYCHFSSLKSLCHICCSIVLYTAEERGQMVKKLCLSNMSSAGLTSFFGSCEYMMTLHSIQPHCVC